MIQRIAALTVLLVGTTAGAGAQMHEHHEPRDSAYQGMAGDMMRGGMMGQGMGMMATGGPGPMMVLRLRDELDLTDDQVQALESIQEELRSRMEGRMQSMMTAHRSAANALRGDDPDLQAYRQRLEGLAEMMVETHVAMAQAAVDTRQVLTPEQREALEAGSGHRR